MHRHAAPLLVLTLLGAVQAQETNLAGPAVSCQLPAGALPGRTRAVFILDTSGSMRGIGDGRADIFDGVKSSINTYVRDTNPNRVELLTFDAGLRSHRSFDHPTATQAGWAAWNGALGALRADGRNTHLYRSLHDALKPLRGADEYQTNVFVLTDGIDNDTNRPFTPQQALAAFTGRGPLDRLHYVALGTDIPDEARQALQRSTYADGLTLSAGQLPDLRGAGLEGGVLQVTDPERVPVPYPDNTPLELDTGNDKASVQLAGRRALAGLTRLKVTGQVPYGAVALLCAPPAVQPGSVAARPRRVLLRLNLTGSFPLVWLNPGASLTMQTGDEIVLRYRAQRGAIPVKLDGLRLSGLPLGLDAHIERLPGAREFTVRLLNRLLKPGQTVTPTLLLPDGSAAPLPTVQGLSGGQLPSAIARPSAEAGGSGSTSLLGQPRFPRRLLWLLLALMAGGVLWAFVWGLLRRRAQQDGLPDENDDEGVTPNVKGLEYSEARTLALVTEKGDVIGVTIPLGGPFDLGQLARVPLLSGLRAEQHRDGMRLLRLPVDLEVSQGTRFLRAGDVIRPGTLLGVTVAKPERVPRLPLGTLSGLGLPLSFRVEPYTMKAVGPYGDHVMNLRSGVTDLGEAFRAPLLSGLKVSPSGEQILLVEVPATLSLRRSGDTVPLRPGTYLPAVTVLDLLPSSPGRSS